MEITNEKSKTTKIFKKNSSKVVTHILNSFQKLKKYDNKGQRIYKRFEKKGDLSKETLFASGFYDITKGTEGESINEHISDG